MKMRVRVDGLKELDAALGELSKAGARGVLRRVGLKAMQPVADAARDMAPDDPETGGNDLRSSITVATRLSARQAKLARKAVREGAHKHFVEVHAGPGPLPHAHLQEFGTAHHGTQPYMRPAWDSTHGQVLDIIKSDLGAEIEKTAKRAARRAARIAANGA